MDGETLCIVHAPNSNPTAQDAQKLLALIPALQTYFGPKRPTILCAEDCEPFWTYEICRALGQTALILDHRLNGGDIEQATAVATMLQREDGSDRSGAVLLITTSESIAISVLRRLHNSHASLPTQLKVGQAFWCWHTQVGRTDVGKILPEHK
jgi:hypothetical protein